jgi:hypothetical protein
MVFEQKLDRFMLMCDCEASRNLFFFLESFKELLTINQDVSFPLTISSNFSNNLSQIAPEKPKHKQVSEECDVYARTFFKNSTTR